MSFLLPLQISFLKSTKVRIKKSWRLQGHVNHLSVRSSSSGHYSNTFNPDVLYFGLLFLFSRLCHGAIEASRVPLLALLAVIWKKGLDIKYIYILAEVIRMNMILELWTVANWGVKCTVYLSLACQFLQQEVKSWSFTLADWIWHETNRLTFGFNMYICIITEWTCA